MNFLEVTPSFNDDGVLVFPQLEDLSCALFEACSEAIHRKYLGVYYSGMSVDGTGDWVFPNKNDNEGYSSLSLDDFYADITRFKF